MLSHKLTSVSDQLYEKIAVGITNCEQNAELCSVFQVKTFPTIHLLKGKSFYMYGGNFDPEDIVASMLK